MSPPIRHVVVYDPTSFYRCLLTIGLIAILLAYAEYRSPGIVSSMLIGLRGFKPDEPAPCKSAFVERPNQRPKWLSTQFTRRAMVVMLRAQRNDYGRCRRHDRYRAMKALSEYYTVSDAMMALDRYLLDDMAIDVDFDPMQSASKLTLL